VDHVCEGANYFAVCDATQGPEAAEAAAFAAGLRALLRGEQEEFTLESSCHSTEAQRWFVGRATRFLAEDGQPCLVVTHRDITDRKQAELKRQEALDLLHHIARKVPGFLYQRRWHPDGTTAFTFASEGVRAIYRIDPEAVLADDSTVFSVLHPEDRAGLLESLQASVESLTPWRHEYRVRFDDGAVRHLSGHALPQREADGSVLWHGIITDITDRKLLEAQLREAQKAESLGLLARGVAHDFNNLLQAIVAAVDTAALHTQPGSRAQLILGLAQRYGGVAQRLGQQLAGLGRLQDHLDEDGHLEPLVRALLQEAPEWADITLTTRFPPGLPLVHFNRERLCQAIGILLTNAREAMPQGGRLELGASLLTISDAVAEQGLLPGNYCDLSVKDTGLGIAADLLPRIFEPYWTSKLAKDQKGQGLSLAICRSVMLAHGGQVRAESQPGQGSTFHLLLPVAQSS
jgi:PAS domain S-box-containing protein